MIRGEREGAFFFRLVFARFWPLSRAQRESGRRAKKSEKKVGGGYRADAN